MDIRSWLTTIGLEHHADTFAKNEIDLEVLRTLTDPDLKELGIDALGARRKILTAVQALNAARCGSSPASRTSMWRRRSSSTSGCGLSRSPPCGPRRRL